jgi:hypothetical protein
MVTSVARMHGPRIGVDGARPLNVRFAEALQEADRALRQDDERDGIFSLMASESSIDLIKARIAEVTAKRYAAEAPHPIVLQHCNEAYRIITRENDGYAALVRKISDAQPRLLSLRSDWRYRKLGSRILPADCFTVLPEINLDYFQPKWLKTTDESKAALDGMHARLKEALRIWSLIERALGFENQPYDQQLMGLAAAAAEDEREMRRQIIALQSEMQALRAIVTKRKQRKAKIA